MMELPEMGGALVSPELYQQEKETPKVEKNLELSPPPSPSQRHYCCPRCQSVNTKFCYYNNYRRSQPRHYCRDCRRYWTVGGKLRNVPVGGSTRRGKRPLDTPSPYIGNMEENKQRRLASRTTVAAPTYVVRKKEASLVSTPSFGPILPNVTTYQPNSGSLPQLPEAQLLNCHDIPFHVSDESSVRNAFYMGSTTRNSSSSSSSNCNSTSSYSADPIPPSFANPSVNPTSIFPDPSDFGSPPY